MSTGHIVLSLILPAYNEVRRLPPYLASARRYLDARYGTRYEVIVVDDGSEDGLLPLLESRAADWPELRWLRHPENRGKGAAVRTGMLAARGELLLFADADGAAPIEEADRLAAAIQAGAAIAVGSRLVQSSGQRSSRRWLRGALGRLFAATARRLLGLSVRDTQCGFKMFRAEVGRELFAQVREPGYLFDLEVLWLAQRRGLPVAELPIQWRETPGGHFHPVREAPRIFLDLWKLRRRLHRDARSQAS
jgi:dolichyl-phosphate beta-glucosyltransferase